MEGVGLGINIGMRASGQASYKGGSSAVGGAGTLTAGVKLSFVAGIIAKFTVQFHAIIQSINKVCHSSANKVTTQAHGGGNPPGWTNTGSHWVSGSGDNVETFIDKLEQDGYQINRDENDWNNGSPKKHGMHKFDLYNLLQSAGYNDQNLTEGQVAIPFGAIQKLVEKRAARANVAGTGNEWLAAENQLDKRGIQVLMPIESTEEIASQWWNGDREWESPDGTIYAVGRDGRIVGFAPSMGYPPDFGLGGIARGAKVTKGLTKILQTGGNTLDKSTLKALNLTKEQGKIAIEGLKKNLGLRSDFHGKILSNGDLVDPRNNQVLGNLFDYLN